METTADWDVHRACAGWGRGQRDQEDEESTLRVAATAKGRQCCSSRALVHRVMLTRVFHGCQCLAQDATGPLLLKKKFERSNKKKADGECDSPPSVTDTVSSAAESAAAPGEAPEGLYGLDAGL